MTELHSGLQAFRGQLRDAIAQDLEHSRGWHRSRRLHGRRRPSYSRRTAIRFGVPLAGAAAAGAAVLALSGGAPVQSADAAILRHVGAALNAPATTILHERALVTAGSKTQVYELWEQTDAPHAYRVIKWGHEGTGRDGSAYDLAATFHSLVTSGKAHVDATTTFDGVPAYKLTVSGADDKFANGTVYVSRGDYHPLLIDTTANGGERIAFQTYEYLPATTANLQLLRMPAGAGPAATSAKDQSAAKR
jgi:hypothetical protein